jgi:hypothetical protein
VVIDEAQRIKDIGLTMKRKKKISSTFLEAYLGSSTEVVNRDNYQAFV